MKRVALKREGFEIELERESASDMAMALPPPPHHPPHPIEAPRDLERPTPPHPHHQAKPDEAPKGVFVTSPMVGTFYASPSPDEPPFVKVGDVIDEESVLCIVEAMKVMNEVKAGKKGKIVEILMKNGDPVEFGSHIFRIEP